MLITHWEVRGVRWFEYENRLGNIENYTRKVDEIFKHEEFKWLRKGRAMQNKDDFEAKRKELELMLSLEHQMSDTSNRLILKLLDFLESEIDTVKKLFQPHYYKSAAALSGLLISCCDRFFNEMD